MAESCAFLSKNRNISCHAEPSVKYLKRYKTLFVFLVVMSSYLAFCAYHASGYVPDVYVCHHMARDLEDSFESLGMDTKIIYGKNADGDGAHLWVSVNGLEIDSVTLLPMSLVKLCGKKYFDIREYDDYMSWAKEEYRPEAYQELLTAGEL